MENKKAISPVVAMALLLVVSVTAVVAFQTWYKDYSSQVLGGAEEESQKTSTQIEKVIDNTLYFKVGFSTIVINSVEVEGTSCSVSGNYTRGVNKITLGNSCTDGLSTDTPTIVVNTNKGIFSQEFYLY